MIDMRLQALRPLAPSRLVEITHQTHTHDPKCNTVTIPGGMCIIAYGLLAQLGERQTEDLKVLGSIPRQAMIVTQSQAPAL